MSEPHPLKQIARVWIRYILPLVVLAMSARVAFTLISNKAETEREEQPDIGTLVEFDVVVLSEQRIDVSGQGEVVAAREVVLQPEVGGRVETLSGELVRGGFVTDGDELIRIERRQYRLAVQQREAELERARAQSDLEQGRRQVAEREFELFQDDIDFDTDATALALRGPQLRDAEASIDAAQAGVSAARLDLNRTIINAPFNAYVRSESVEVGQLVGPASPLAMLVGTDAFWVQVSLPPEDLNRIAIPGVNGSVSSRVVVWQERGNRRLEWEGRVIRLLGDLDPVGRMARVVIEVVDPFDLAHPPDSRRGPLFLGAFVHVDIEGTRAHSVAEVTNRAIRNGNSVFVMTAENTLEIREISIHWRLETSVLIDAGLENGDRVITSHLGTPVEGMDLRTADTTPELETDDGGDGVSTDDDSPSESTGPDREVTATEEAPQ